MLLPHSFNKNDKCLHSCLMHLIYFPLLCYFWSLTVFDMLCSIRKHEYSGIKLLATSLFLMVPLVENVGCSSQGCVAD